MGKNQLSVTCPVCGRKSDYIVDVLVEGATFTCVFCRLKLTLHGHMLEEIQNEVKKIKQEV